MKTLKLSFVATLVAFAMVSVANADGIKEKPKFIKAVNITIDKAIQDPGLVAAMYAQIKTNFILPFPLPPITFEVKYNGAIYRISGSQLQWMSFFGIHIYPPPPPGAKMKETI